VQRAALEDTVKSTFCALAALLCLISAPFGVSPTMGVRAASAQAAEPDTANACVGFQNRVGDKEIAVHADNDCERRLTCTLDYSVRCEDNTGKVTSRAQKRSPFNLPPKGNADLTLSATDCKQGWAIDDLVWNCR
jgi:hypothetical protein